MASKTPSKQTPQAGTWADVQPAIRAATDELHAAMDTGASEAELRVLRERLAALLKQAAPAIEEQRRRFNDGAQVGALRQLREGSQEFREALKVLPKVLRRRLPVGTPMPRGAHIELKQRWKGGRLEWVMRTPGKAGADLKQLPLGTWLAEQEAEFLRLNAKFYKQAQCVVNSKAGVGTRASKAQALEDAVRQLKAMHGIRMGRNLAGFIAARVKRSKRRIEQILAKLDKEEKAK